MMFQMAQAFTDMVQLTIISDKEVESGPHNVPGSKKLKWSLVIHPFGSDNTCDRMEAQLCVSGGNVNVDATFDIRDNYNGYNESATFCKELVNGQSDVLLFYDNDDIYNGNINSDCTCVVTCTATFYIEKIKLDHVVLRELIDPWAPHCWNAKIVIGIDEIKVHRGFLSMISPVFNAMFSPETKESKTGVINITDFSVDTVQNALDYCYGVNLEMETTDEIIDMLRFYDKYDIQPAMNKLESKLLTSLTIKNFAPIAAYAWQYSRQSLQAECGRMFVINLNALALRSDFLDLGQSIVAGVLKAAADSRENADSIFDYNLNHKFL